MYFIFLLSTDNTFKVITQEESKTVRKHKWTNKASPPKPEFVNYAGYILLLFSASNSSTDVSQKWRQRVYINILLMKTSYILVRIVSIRRYFTHRYLFHTYFRIAFYKKICEKSMYKIKWYSVHVIDALKIIYSLYRSFSHICFSCSVVRQSFQLSKGRC